tara:strand:- start:379 stop:804 length:426 start_codon:yes stop_codon:yes gene_type:complete
MVRQMDIDSPNKTYRFEYKEQYQDNINWLVNNKDILSPTQLDVLEICRTAKIIQRSKHVLWAHCLRMLKDAEYKKRSLIAIGNSVSHNEAVKKTLRRSYLQTIRDFMESSHKAIVKDSISVRVPVNQQYEVWKRILDESYV